MAKHKKHKKQNGDRSHIDNIDETNKHIVLRICSECCLEDDDKYFRNISSDDQQPVFMCMRCLNNYCESCDCVKDNIIIHKNFFENISEYKQICGDCYQISVQHILKLDREYDTISIDRIKGNVYGL